jgi:type II restriction/modification system DNA methylase subunit YeeA
MAVQSTAPGIDPDDAIDVPAFLAKWGLGSKSRGFNERAGAQSHFVELCSILGVDAPNDPETYTFERRFHRHNKALGYADVWKRGCFAWEYKAPGRSLEEALDQLMKYALPLENPPLLVVCDRERYEIHTHFTGYASECMSFKHSDLARSETRATLRSIFSDPYSFRPGLTSVDITKDAAQGFAAVAERMQARGVEPHVAAHFLTQCLFCMFAQDAGLLRTELFKSLTENKHDGASLRRGLTKLFTVMRTGGDFGVEDIAWFNGGLFEVVDVPEVADEDVQALRTAASLDWRGLDPSIFGTLFERGLDPRKRRQLGAHYTDPETIAKLVGPVVERPLITAWVQAKAEIVRLLGSRDLLRREADALLSTSQHEKVQRNRRRARANAAQREAQDVFNQFLEHLREFRVLDPACGSGNFLYVALRTLKDVEHHVTYEAEGLGLHRQIPVTGPQNVLGIERNAYAAELSRVTVWIGELQWRMQHGYGWKTNPILEPLDQIECRDALVTENGDEAMWPRASVVVGNPPFLGNKRMRDELGSQYAEKVRRIFSNTVPAGADFVCYWFDKALKAIKTNGLGAAGLVATQAIRHSSNRVVLDTVVRDSRIFEAWSDEPWVNDGAAVRVSMICFGRWDGAARLNGTDAPRIAADLSGNAGLDLTTARPLAANLGVAFQGVSKVGAFDIPGSLAREWLRLPNPNGRPNSDVLRPWANGQTVAKRSADEWIVDFGTELTESDASLYEAPFAHIARLVKPERSDNNREAYRRYWWRHAEPRTGLRQACKPLRRVIATPRVSKHRFFAWLDAAVLPDTRLYVVARDDDWMFGVLSSRIHEVWSLANASVHGDGANGGRPTYTAQACFETFPLPEGSAEPVAAAARRLSDLRERWLNPPEWTARVPEVVPTGMTRSPYPDRAVPKTGHEKALAARTLTNLYNEPPQWLIDAHRTLDVAVASAYGWTEDISSVGDLEILRRLLVLNHRRSHGQPGSQMRLPLRLSGPTSLVGQRSASGIEDVVDAPSKPVRVAHPRRAGRRG